MKRNKIIGQGGNAFPPRKVCTARRRGRLRYARTAQRGLGARWVPRTFPAAKSFGVRELASYGGGSQSKEGRRVVISSPTSVNGGLDDTRLGDEGRSGQGRHRAGLLQPERVD